MAPRDNPSADELPIVVLLAHGSHDARWREPFEALAASLSAGLLDGRVLLAYLQFAAPTLTDALFTCQARGARRVLVVPAFMSGGGHLLRDVPCAVEDAARAVGSEIAVTLSGALGEEAEVLAGMAAAVRRLVAASAGG